MRDREGLLVKPDMGLPVKEAPLTTRACQARINAERLPYHRCCTVCLFPVLRGGQRRISTTEHFEGQEEDVGFYGQCAISESSFHYVPASQSAAGCRAC